MIKLVRKTSFLILNRPLSFFFGSSSNSHHEHEDIPVITKHNPTGQKDLRGHQNLEGLSDLQKSYSPLHNSNSSSLLSLHRISSYLPNSIARNLAKLVAHPKQTIASQNLNLPLINPGAIPVYDALNIVSSYSLMNQVLVCAGPLSSLIFQPHPLLSAFTISSLGYIYYQLRWKIGKDIVVKLQLLPHTEQLCYQKLSIFGYLYTKKVSINDLQHTTFDQIYGQHDPSQKSSRGMFNPEVAFRNKLTGELLYFSNNGIWNGQGINHPLLI